MRISRFTVLSSLLLTVAATTACSDKTGQTSSGAQDGEATQAEGKKAKKSKTLPIEQFSGVWQRSAGNLTPVRLTEYGLKVSAGTGTFDDPTTACKGFSIPRSTISEFGVTKIAADKGVVTISYENEGDRRMPLDGKTVSTSKTLAGDSVARLVGNSIEIESTGFGPEGRNMMMGQGIPGAGIVYPLSEQARVFERYTLLSPDTLDFVMVIQDPKITVWPRVIHARWKKLPADTPFIEGQCELPEDPFAASGKGAKLGQ